MSKSILLSRAVATATAVLCGCLLACASTAAAFTPATKGGTEDEPLNLSGSAATHAPSAGGASIVRTIVGLAIVIAVIWGLAWILKQVKAGREGGLGANSSSAGLASVAALTLGSGRAVHLVRAGNDYVLLGATEHGLASIHRYTAEQAHEAGLLLDEPEPERSRLATVASQIVAGAGRAVGQSSYAARSGFSEQRALPRESGQDAARAQAGGYGREDFPALLDQSLHSPAASARPDPMRMSPPATGVIARLREMTVRR